MSNLRQVGLGILAALVSVAILFGSLSLALMENAPRLALSSFPTFNLSTALQASLTPTPTRFSSPTAFTSTPTPTSTSSPTSSASVTPSSSASASPSASPTATGTPVPSCHIPSDWIQINLHSGDTLDSLAAEYNVSASALAKINCLGPSGLDGRKTLYVPNPPTSTPIPCGHPSGWVIYIVQAGDTLFHIAQLSGVTVQQLIYANCLHSDQINVNQPLWVPHPLATPTPTEKPHKTPRPPTSTPRPTSITPTGSPTNTSAVPSNTPVPPPSNTPVPPPSNTPVPPPSNTPIPPPSNTPFPPPSDTPVPPPSDTPVPPVPTAT